MSEIHKWEIEGRDVFIDRYAVHGIDTMTKEEAEIRINATDELSEAEARVAHMVCHNQGLMDLATKLLAYADILEGKR